MNKVNLGAVLLLTAASLSADSFTYQTIAVPGATSTNPVGIDDQGQIVGNYTNSTGTYGFIDTNGTFTSLPGANVINVSSNGTLLVSTSTGYATYVNGNYSPLTIPGLPYYLSLPPFPVTPVAINDSGQLLGNASGFTVLISGGHATWIGGVNGVFSIGSSNLSATGLNNQAEAVSTQVLFNPGVTAGGGALPAFGGIYDSSTNTWTFVQAPGSAATNFSAINNLNQIVGYTLGGYSANYSDPEALLYSGGIFTSLSVPNTSNSQATGINDLGEIVGFGNNADGPDEGFLAIPETNAAVPEPLTFTLSILGLAVFWVSKSYLRWRA